MITVSETKLKKLIQDSLIEFWDHVYPTIANQLAVEAMETRLSDQINQVGADVKDVKRRVQDLEIDTPTRTEFKQLKDRLIA